jgi:tetratricopeptide (TPR) repeat protein
MVVVMAALRAGPAAGADAAAAAGGQWAARDVQGAAVGVPDVKRPTVILCLLAGQPQTAQVTDALRAVLVTAPDAQVVAVVSGTDAAAQIKQMTSGAGPFPWPIVADADHAASGKWGVHAWPTTVIVSPSGEQVMHLAGLPKGYANDVEAHLAFAAGQIDRAALAGRLADRKAVTGGPDQVARRHVQVAKRLMQSGLAEQARAELDRALAVQPADADAQAMMVELMLNAGDAAAAGAILDRLEAGEAGPRVRLLRGRWLVAAGKWDEARAALAQAVRLNPDPAEAYYQLGLVHEHDGDWAAAASAFRKAFEHTAVGRAMPPTTAPAKVDRPAPAKP